MAAKPDSTHHLRTLEEYAGGSLDTMLVVEDASRAIRAFRAGGRTLLGYGVQEILHLRLDDIVAPESLSSIIHAVHAVATGERPEQAIETTCRGKTGRPVPVRARVLGISPRQFPGCVLLALTENEQPGSGLPGEAALFLNAVIENIPDMVFVKEAQRLRFVLFNKAGERLLGYSRQDLLGKSDYDFWPREQAEFFVAKDRETLRNGRLVEIAEEPIRTRGGDVRWLHTKKVPITDHNGTPIYLLGISQDITARKLAEEHAMRLEREICSIVEHAREAIVTWSADGTIVTWNPGASALYGMPAEKAIGRKMECFVPEHGRAAFSGAQQALLRSEPVPPAEVYRLREGAEILVEDSLFLLRASGANPRFASIARDLTAIARLERATELMSGVSQLRQSDRNPEQYSPAMQAVLDSARKAAQNRQATVLLLGETGVGKGWLAKWIHANSTRSHKPFLDINCAGLSPELMESELFGHEPGAFTGAAKQKPGLVEAADGGTLFLDEVGELPANVQAKLLSFLDQRTFRRLGGIRNLTADVRVVAATNSDLKAAAERGCFRKDLYYRISVFPLHIPPLRERKEEIAGLVADLIPTLGIGLEGRDLIKRPGVMEAFCNYAWPGNIRELRNLLERAVILRHGTSIELADLPPELLQCAAPERSDERLTGTASTAGAPYEAQLDEVELSHIRSVLDRVSGNRSEAARVLGISRSTLKRKLARMEKHSG